MLAELLPLACRASGTLAAEQTLAAESKIEAAARMAAQQSRELIMALAKRLEN